MGVLACCSGAFCHSSTPRRPQPSSLYRLSSARRQCPADATSRLGALFAVPYGAVTVVSGATPLPSDVSQGEPWTMADQQGNLTLAERLYIPEILRGLKLTFSHLFRPKVTMQYPEQRWELPP